MMDSRLFRQNPTRSPLPPGQMPGPMSRVAVCLLASCRPAGLPPGGSERRNAGPLPWGPDPEARPSLGRRPRPEAENVRLVRKRRPKAENRGLAA